MFKVNIKKLKRRHERRSGVFIVNFEQMNVGWVGLDFEGYFTLHH